VIGAAVAADLAREGATVTVMESDQVAAGTSKTTFAWTNANAKQPRSYFDLNVEGMHAHRRFASSVASCDWYHETGNLEWTADTEAQQELEHAAVGMSMTGQRIHGVRTSDGQTVRTDAVVNCAGPGAGEVAALAGVDLPMRNTAGLLAYTTPTAVAVGRVIHALQIHLRPAAGGRLVLGTRTADAAVPTPDEGSRIAEPGAAEAMLHLAEQLYPDLRDSRVQESRIGVRPIPIDGLPVLGPSATIENFHFAVTHSGVTLCLRVAELISAEVRGELVDELEPFRHSRLNARQPPSISTTHETPGGRSKGP
jgi:glycine/D-amino acid oxidase-like deaminating enzyme